MTKSGLSLESRQLLEDNSNVIAFVQHALSAPEQQELNSQAQAGLILVLDNIQGDLRSIAAA